MDIQTVRLLLCIYCSVLVLITQIFVSSSDAIHIHPIALCDMVRHKYIKRFNCVEKKTQEKLIIRANTPRDMRVSSYASVTLILST